MSTYYRQGQSDAYALASLDPPTLGVFARRYNQPHARNAARTVAYAVDAARVQARYAEYLRGWRRASRDARKVRGVR